MQFKESLLEKFIESLSLGGDGVLRYKGRLFVPDVYGLWDQILDEENGSCYSIHPGSTKIYHDLREILKLIYLP